MNIKRKKRTLLRSPLSKNTKKKSLRPPSHPIDNLITKAPAKSLSSHPPKSNQKMVGSLILLIALVLFIIPKPKLITYEALGSVTQSIYWSGFPTMKPKLYDTSLHLNAALEKDTLYLCYDEFDPKSCQRYQIIEQSGLLSILINAIKD